MIPTITRKKNGASCRLAVPGGGALQGFAAFLVLALSLWATTGIQAQIDCQPLNCPGNVTVNIGSGASEPGIDQESSVDCGAYLSWNMVQEGADCVTEFQNLVSANVLIGGLPDGNPVALSILGNQGGCSDVLGFTGPFAPSQWALNGPNTFTVTGDSLDLFDTGATASVTAPCDGRIIFKASIVGSGSACCVEDLDVRIGGDLVLELNDPDGNPLQAGPYEETFSFLVQGGQVIQFAARETSEWTISEWAFEGINPGEWGLAGVFPAGETTRVTVSNPNGDDCVFDVTVNDEEAPVARCADMGTGGNLTYALDGNGLIEVLATDFDNGSTDNCGITGYTASRDGGANFSQTLNFSCDDIPAGTDRVVLDVILQVTDAAGNTATCETAVQIKDETQAVFSNLPGDQVQSATTGSCEYDFTSLPTPTVIDGCLGTEDMMFQSRSDGATNLLDPYPVGITAVTWTYENPNKGVSEPLTYVYNVIVQDNEDPTIAFADCPVADVPAGQDSCGATVNYTLDVDDNCNADQVTVICNHVSGSFFPVGTTTVVCTAIDSSGNTAQATCDITVVDNQNPTIACPTGQFLESVCPNVPLPDYRGLALINDNCGIDNVTQVPPPGTPLSNFFPLSQDSTIDITLTVTDLAGLSTSCTFALTFQDNNAPIITDFKQFAIRDCNGDDVIDMNDNLEFGCTDPLASVEFVVPYAIDCNGDTVWGILPGATGAPLGVTYNNNGGNSANPPTVTLAGTFNGGQLTWCFPDAQPGGPGNPGGSQGNIICYKTLTYSWMDDNKAPQVNAPDDLTLFTSEDADNNCSFDTVPDVAMLEFDPAACEIMMCMTPPDFQVYPLNSLGCDTFFTDPDGDFYGGRFTDNCGVQKVEFKRTYYRGCAPFATLPAPTEVNDFAPAANNDPNELFKYGPGLHEIVVKVTDNANPNLMATDTFYVTIIDDEDPAWDKEVAKKADGDPNILGDVLGEVAVEEQMPAEFGNSAPESVELEFVLDCNNPNFIADLATLDAWAPTATDECFNPTIVTLSAGFPDTTDYDCTTQTVEVSDTTWPYVKQRIRKRFEARDSCGNKLDNSGDADERYLLKVFLADYQAPIWDPNYDVAGDAIEGTAMVPNPDPNAVDCDTAFSGPKDIVKQYTCDAGTDTLKLFLSDYDVVPTDDICYLTQDQVAENIAAKAVDCTPEGMISYTYQVDETTDCYGNAITDIDPAEVNVGQADSVNAAGALAEWPVAIYNITYTATDMCGLTSTYSFVLKIVDDVEPEFPDCPDDITANALAGNCFNVVTWDPPSARDNCRGATDIKVTATDPLGEEIVLWGGSEGSCEDALDFTGDFLSTNWIYTNNGGNGSVDESNAPNSITMNASTSTAANTEFCINITENGVINFDYQSNNGQIKQDQFGYSVDGGTNVEWFIIPGTAGQNIVGSYSVIVESGDQFCFVVGSNGNGNSGSITLSNFNFQCADNNVYGAFPVGVSTVHYTATDFCGMPLNTAECTFTVTIFDNQAPVALCVDTVDLVLDRFCNAYVSVAQVDAGSWDACYLDSMWLSGTNNAYNGEFFTITDGPGTYEFDLVVQDSSGNTDTCNTVINLLDQTPPDLLCTPYYQRDANGDCEWVMGSAGFDPTASDACGTVTVTHDYNKAGDAGYDGTNTENSLENAVFPLGTTTVTWTATDGSGNTAQCTSVIEVVDNTNPDVTCSDVSVATDNDDNSCGTNVNFTIDATDNCNVNTIGASPASGSFFAVGTTTVTAWAIDDAGNSDTCSFEVTVTDGTDPTLACNDITVTLDAAGSAYITPQQVANATDNCGEVPTLTVSRDSFGCGDLNSPTGTVTVTVTATDANNNTATCDVTVTVQDYGDDWAFVFCPADVETDNSATGLCEANVTLPQPQVQAGCSDNVTLPFTAATRSDGLAYNDPYPVGTTTVTWTYTSPISGNVITCQYNVNVADVVSPVVTNCPDDITVTMQNQGQCGAMMVDWDEPTATDECTDFNALNSLPLRQRSHAPGDVFGAGTTLVTYEWEDEAGNPVICEFSVTVVDTIRPELECPFGQVVTWTLDECGKATIPLINFGVGSDNCGIEKRCVKIDTDGDGIREIYCEPDTMLMIDCNSTAYCDTAYLWYWIEDKNGNVSDTCDLALTVIDTIKPAVCAYDTCLFTTVKEKEVCSAEYTYEIPFVVCTPEGDKPVCDGSRTQGSSFYYDNDTCSNLAVRYRVDQVADCNGPFADPDMQINWTDVDPETGGLSIDWNFKVGRTRIIIEVSDKNYTVSDTGYVNVIDTIAPWAVCPNDVTVGTNDGHECVSHQTLTPPVVTDNCIVDEVIVSVDEYCDGTIDWTTSLTFDKNACPDLPTWDYSFPKGDHKITYTYSDLCEYNYAAECPNDWVGKNTSSCDYKITVNDSIPPVVCQAPGYECQYDEDNFDKPIVYIPTTTDNLPDTCECYGVFDQDIGFKDDCDTLTVTKIVARVDLLPGGITGIEVVEWFYNNQPSFPQNLSFSEVKTYSAKGANADCPFIFENNDVLKKGDWHYFYIAEDCGGFTVDTSFTVRVYDDVDPEILDCPGDVTMEALKGECFAEVWWDIPMMFDDNCKVVTDWSCSAEHHGQEIKITSVDPQGCDSKVGFKGQWDNNFWTTAGDPQGYLAQHTADKMVLVDPNFNPFYTSRCVTVPNDGLLSFHLSLTGPGFSDFGVNGGFINDGNFENLFIGGLFGPNNGNEQDFYFTVPVEAGTEFCFFVQNGSTLEVTDFQFTCGGAQHKGLFPVGESTITYVISDGMTYEYCGDIIGPNYDTCTINVTVEDTQDPMAMCQDITVQVINGVAATITPEDVDGGSADNCGKIANKEIIGQTSFGCADIGQDIPVQLVVFDQAGNSDTCTSIVTVQEVANPTISSCPSSQTLYVGDDCLAELIYATPQVVTGCATVDMNWVSGPLSGDDLAPGNYTVVYEYNVNGGTLTCEFAVTVEDNTAPTFGVEVDGAAIADGSTINITAASGLCSATAEWEVVNIDDNCDNDPEMTMTHASGGVFPVGCTKVTITVTDDAGNATNFSFFVCVADDEAPLVTCQDVTLFLNDDGYALLEPLDVLTLLQDDCGIDELILSQDSFRCADLGVNDETITVTDAGGNATVCDFTVTVIDNIDPTAVCQDITVQLDETGNVSITAADVDGGSFDNTECFTLSIDKDAFTCANIGDNDVVLTIEDAAGNSDNCTATVTVEDNVAPIIVECPAGVNYQGLEGDFAPGNWDISIDGDGSVDASNAPASISLTGTDDGLDDAETNVCITLPASGTLSFDWDYSSDNGSATFDPFFYTLGGSEVNLTSGSTSTTQNGTVSVSVNAGEQFCFSQRSTDGILGAATTTISNFSLSEPAYVATNDAGECGANVEYDIPTFFDNCDGEVEGTLIEGPASGEFFEVGVTQVSYNYTDAQGNVSETCTFFVQVNDNEDPSITCPADFVGVPNDQGICGAAVVYDVTADDNCEVASIDLITGLPSGAIFPVGTTTVTYRATDIYGNSSECSFTVEVLDVEAPTLATGSNCPADVTIAATLNECDQIYTWEPPFAADDNCDGFFNRFSGKIQEDLIDPEGNVNTTILAQYNYQGTLPANLQQAQFPVGTSTVRYTATDNAGNSGVICEFTVTVTDDQAPMIICPATQVLSSTCEDFPIPDYTGMPAVFDNCSKTLTVTQSPLAETLLGDVPVVDANGNGIMDEGDYFVVTLTVSDGSNTANCSFNVVLDNFGEPVPAVSPLPELVGECGELCVEAPVAYDECGELIYGLPSFAQGICGDNSYLYTSDPGLYFVLWTYEDDNGNTRSQLQQITVTDDVVAPEVECQDVVVELDASGQGSISVSDVLLSATDNCTAEEDLVVELSDDAFDCSNLAAGGSDPWINEFHYDNAGSDIKEFIEVAGPAGTDLSTYSLVLYNGSNGTVYNTIALSGSIDDEGDGYGAVDFQLPSNGLQNGSPDGIALVDNGTVVEFISYEGSLSATDGPANGMTSTDVGVSEGGGASPDESLQLVGAGSTGSAFAWSGPSTASPGSLNDGQIIAGGVTVIISVTDEAGNTGTCELTVNVVDNLAPEAKCKSGLVVSLDENGNGSLTAEAVDNGSFDNCGITSLTIDKTSFTCADLGTVTVTLTAVDGSGNESSCTTDVEVVDEIDPNAVCTDITVQLDATGNASITVADIDGGSSDNCTIVSMTLSQSSFDCGDVGANTVTLTVVDQSGNVSTCNATVTVEDNVAPEITCSDDIESCCANHTVAAVASDACGIAEVAYAATLADGTTLNGVGSELTLDFPAGVSTVTFQATDVNGNTNDCTVTVNVTDDQDPIATCKSNINITIGSDGTVTLPAQFFDGGSFDVGCNNPAEAGIVSYQISVNGSPLADSYTFTCDDLGFIEYMLVVSDCAGNTATCWADGIRIEDKTAPNCDAADITVDVAASCEATITAEQLGAATTDNCTSFDDLILLVNGEESITVDVDHVPGVSYTLTAEDAAGNVSTCTGFITVTTEGVQCTTTPFVLQLDENGQASLTDDDLETAIGLTIPSCAAASAEFGQTDFDCTDIGTNFITVTITSAAGGVSTCTVEVIVEDNIAPECGNIPAQVVELDANGQGALSNIDLTSISDNCTAFGDLDIQFSIPGPFDCDDVGNQDFTVTVTDASGNSTVCTVSVEVVDLLGPSFVCDDSHVVVLNGAGQGFLTVGDIIENFNGNSNGTEPSDNCGIANSWLSKTSFDCTELGDNEVIAYVEDVNGNINTCTTTVEVVANDPALDIIITATKTDETAPGANDGTAEVTSVTNGFGNDISGNVTYNWSGPNGFSATTAAISGLEPGDYCGLITNTNTGCATLACVTIQPATGPTTVQLAGALTTDYGVDIECVDVILSGDDNQTVASNTNGEYNFTVAAEGDYTVEPYSNANPTQGVKTSDLVYIQLHVLNLLKLDNPYKVIAADADNDSKVSTIDLVYLQALILGNISELPTNTSWRFVDADHVFTNANDPWNAPFPESISYTDVQADQLEGDFVAIKVGDVTEEANTACAGGTLQGGAGIDSRDAGSLTMRAEEVQVTAGQEYRVDVTAKDFNNLLGYQLSIDFDETTLELSEVVPGVVTDLSEANFGLNKVDEGLILTSWVNAQGETVADDEVLFTMVFKATADAAKLSSLLSFSDEGPLANEAYSRDGKYNVSLEFVGEDAEEFALMQNTPNPFKDQTIIGFVLPKDAPASLTLMDATGRVLKVIDGSFNQGYNEVMVNRNDLPAAGVVYYQLRTEGYSATKQMIVIE